jgi:hypothetical protein
MSPWIIHNYRSGSFESTVAFLQKDIFGVKYRIRLPMPDTLVYPIDGAIRLPPH